jgi:response regulator RpfG family c-di-GMP phosphodiesterase
MKTLLFVDDEPKVLQGLQRQLRLMRNEWDMNFVEGGPQALAFMASRPVDIIVSDMKMPGMDGSQLLSEVVLRHPQTVRIILSGHAESEAVLRLVGPAHQYLSKPCDPDELRKAITHAFALRDLLGNERLKRLITRIKHLPTLPAMQNEFTKELRKDSPSLEHIGEIISRDIGMTAKILQLVNSAFFGLAQPVSNPTEAVIYLGLNTIRSLALSVEIFSQYDQKVCQSFSLDVLAHHSWVAGSMARCLAQMERRELKILEQCFLAGLLHDIGQLILAFGLHEEYSEVIAKAKKKICRCGRWSRNFSAPRTRTSAPISLLCGACPIPSSKQWPCIINLRAAPNRNFRRRSRCMWRMRSRTNFRKPTPRCLRRPSTSPISPASVLPTVLRRGRTAAGN